MNSQISIEHIKVGRSHPPFVIAEMSANHNGSLERALKLVEVAADSGVQAIKLQTYTADTMTLNSREKEFVISDPDSLWYGKTLYELYDEAHTPWEWHQPIFEKANDLGLLAFSTPFDETSVDFLESLEVPCYKIASFENTDIPLVKKVASTGKPLLISIGMATVAEIDETVETARRAGCEQIVLLKCTSTYPASAKNTNILTLPHLRDLFNCEVGLSDHTLGIGVSVASVALGATVIEKHFTLNRLEGGVDSSFSMEPEEMRSLVKETKQAWQALGVVRYGPTEVEKKSLLFKRTLYVAQDIKAGDQLTTENMRALRPGFGLLPRYFDILLGKTVRRDLTKGTAITWDILS